MVRAAALILLLVTTTAIAREPEVTPLGMGKYLATIQAASGFGGTKHLKPKALRAADAFCRSQGKDFQTLEVIENEGPFVLGKYPRAEVTFQCVDPAAH